MSWMIKYRYAILCLLVFVIMSLHTRNGQWYGDFWEHSAVVRELATNFSHPFHPLLLLDAPHAFYSPYAVLVALLARTFHLDAIQALSMMGLVNLGVWFVGLRLFVFSMVPAHRNAIAFYTLILTLFWWGSFAWAGFGGFFHIGVLGNILPYPSTFGAALAFIAIGLNQRRMETRRLAYFIPIFLVAVIVLISHPITFLFFTVALVSQSCTDRGSVCYQLLLIGVLFGLTFLAAVYWPYFPVGDFFLLESGKFHFSNRLMYHQVLSKIWPALLVIPLVIPTLKSKWRRSLVLMLMTLSGIYVFGAITDQYAFGRLISYIVLLLHIFLAEHISILEWKLHEIVGPRRLTPLVVPLGVILIAGLLSLKPLKFTLDKSVRDYPPTYKNYQFLSQFTGQYEVVLADIISSWMIPAFGGKIIAAEHAQAFIPDYDVRRSDVERFFNKGSTLSERQQVVQKYNATYLLLNKLMKQHLMQTTMPHGRIVFENDNFILIFLGPN